MQKTLKAPAEVYQAIRQAHPREKFGDHWAGVGHYVGDGVWADPKHMGSPGEYSFRYQAHKLRQERETRHRSL